MNEIEAQVRKSFPRQEEYIDCSGQKRVFELDLGQVLSPGFLLSAREITESEYGYEFSVFAEADPFAGFGRLRRKIRRELSRRYLMRTDEGGLSMSHDELAGIISDQGLVVDGQLLRWAKLRELILTHEGFHIHLKISGGDE